MKNIFKRKYVGPSGPHLNCLTETSITGTYTENHQRSIHSTRDGGRGKNTSKPRNPNRKGKLAKASAELDRRRREHSAILGRLKAGEERSFRAPGSMNY